MRVKVVGGSVCVEREGEYTERERERERWQVCAERGKECVLKYREREREREGVCVAIERGCVER